MDRTESTIPWRSDNIAFVWTLETENNSKEWGDGEEISTRIVYVYDYDGHSRPYVDVRAKLAPVSKISSIYRSSFTHMLIDQLKNE
jgi:hypothetical protein